VRFAQGTASTDQTADAYLPLRALSAYSGLSLRTLRGYLVHRSHPLPHYRIGGKVLVRRSDFDGWAARFRVVHTPAAVDAMVGEVLSGLRV
jgi:hypothetical protein